MQAAEGRPLVFPKVPAGQGLHTAEPAREYCPAGQMHAVALVDPATQAYPAVQLPEQAVVVRPAVAPYKPAAHGLHVPAAPRLNVPGAQTTAVALVDPSGQAYPGLQPPEQDGTDRPAAAP